MKTHFLFIVFALCFSVLAAQNKEYLCMPCGNSCDTVVYTKPGTCPTCHMKLVEKKAIQFENVTSEEFCKRITNNPNVVMLDVRSQSEFDGSAWRDTFGHFRNSININVEELEKRLEELAKYKDREVLVYCSHSVRSTRAAMLLTQNGFRNVKDLAGGISTLKTKGNACLEKNFIVHK